VVEAGGPTAQETSVIRTAAAAAARKRLFFPALNLAIV